MDLHVRSGSNCSTHLLANKTPQFRLVTDDTLDSPLDALLHLFLEIDCPDANLLVALLAFRTEGCAIGVGQSFVGYREAVT